MLRKGGREEGRKEGRKERTHPLWSRVSQKLYIFCLQVFMCGIFLTIPHTVDIGHYSGTPTNVAGVWGLTLRVGTVTGYCSTHARIDGTDRHFIARHRGGGKPPSFGVRQQSNRPLRKRRYPALHPRLPLCYALSCIATLSANRTSSVYLHDKERLQLT